MAPQTLELTPVESTLRRLLLDVADWINNANPSSPKLELRYTGGWVRDKLLGVGSHDIDIAINNMTGEQFGLKMQEYLEKPGNLEKYENVGAVGLHRIEANPEKSKHLETTTTKIFGLDIDLVNLRKETYTQDSRNPQVEFGTPEEDALRRDATVNAMFYNLQTSQVEDFTGRGLEDMQRKIIRTPLEPLQTFKDDPLRVLRLIRFASRLGYSIDPDAEEAMQSREVKADFKLKITRERVGVEFEKMLRGPDPHQALALIDKLGLYTTIFDNPTKDYGYTPELKHLPLAYNFISRVLSPGSDSAQALPNVRSCFIPQAEDEYVAWLLSSVIPLADAPDTLSPKGKPLVLAQVIAWEGFKVPNKYGDIITSCVRNRQEIEQLKDKCLSQKLSPQKKSEGDDATARDTLGLHIRKWGPSWKYQALFALLHEIVNAPEAEKSIVNSYESFFQHVSELGLVDAFNFKPLLTGTDLAKTLGMKPGPWMKEALEVVMAWQLAHPDVTDGSQAIEALRTDLEVTATSAAADSKSELPFRLAHHFLSSTLRPIFAQSKEQKKHGPVTASGHKNTRELPPPKISMNDIAEGEKLWKGKNSWAIDLLKWSISVLDTKNVQKNWPVLLPPIMTLLDDIDIPWKAQGVAMLNLLLQRTSPELLARTGLGDVFEKELIPLFTYLPSLTPEDDSILLLNSTFPALLTLTNTRYPLSTTQKSPMDILTKREKALDNILRKGVLAPFLHAGDHVRIAELLLTHLPPIVDALGISSVKHLKELIPLLSKILSDPFGSAHPPLLIRAAQALQAIIRNGKPRMAYHRAGVLRGVCVCWVRLVDNGGAFEDVKVELGEVVRLLRKAVDGEVDVDLRADFGVLIDADERLEPLLRFD